MPSSEWWTALVAIVSNPLVAGALGVLIGGLALGLFSPWFGRRERALAEHKRRLLIELNKPFESEASIQYAGSGRTVPPRRLPRSKWVTDHSSASKLLRHLSDPSYGSFMTVLDRAIATADRNATELETAIARFESEVEVRLREVTKLSDWAGRPTAYGFCDFASVRLAIFNDVSIRLSDPGQSLPPITVQRGNMFMPGSTGVGLIWDSRRLAEGSESEVNPVSECIRHLREDPSITELVKTIRDTDRRRFNSLDREAFEELRLSVVERLEARQERPRGRCPLCPPLIGALPMDSLGTS
jgi:hypothetical protein